MLNLRILPFTPPHFEPPSLGVPGLLPPPSDSDPLCDPLSSCDALDIELSGRLIAHNLGLIRVSVFGVYCSAFRVEVEPLQDIFDLVKHMVVLMLLKMNLESKVWGLLSRQAHPLREVEASGFGIRAEGLTWLWATLTQPSATHCRGVLPPTWGRHRHVAPSEE